MRLYNPFNFNGVSAAEAMLRASAFSVVTAICLIFIKAIALWQSGSLSVMASLTDSGLDLISSLITFMAVRFAKTPPDAEHPFGHGKAEAFSALFQAGLVFASAALVGRDCIDHWINPEPLKAEGLAMGVLLASIGLTFLLVTLQTRALKAANSVAISADRAHYAVDLASNIVALLGVALSALGWHQFDSIAALAVVAMLVWSAIGVMREAADHLMDRGLEKADLTQIEAMVLEDKRILNVHQLRTRISGPYVLIQMHIDLDAEQSLKEAHKIIVAAENRVLKAYANADILIHADPHGYAEPHGGVFNEHHEA